jgi:biofilm PGA synthesis N-glycosyltransferase PgaC
MGDESSMLLALCYWSCLILAVYPYFGYPVIAALMARLHSRSIHSLSHERRPVSIVIAAYNEALQISHRVKDLARLAAAVHPDSEVIVVSDGSTDGTAETVRSCSTTNMRLIELPLNQGKAVALNSGVAAARHEWVAFADVRQTWDDNTLQRLLDRFVDPQIGAVSGDLDLRNVNGDLASVDLYWRLEKMLRINESCWHSSIGVTGAVCAVRRSLFKPLPAGTVLDDVYWPMAVVLQGLRVVHEPRAVAHDRLPEEINSEYQRKLRTLAGNYQLLSLMPILLLPWKNPVWLQFISHKLLRLVTPWLLLLCWGLSFALIGTMCYRFLFVGQTIVFILALLACGSTTVRRLRLCGMIAAVFVMNYAAWLAFWIWIGGGTTRTWKKIAYAEAGAATDDCAMNEPSSR